MRGSYRLSAHAEDDLHWIWRYGLEQWGEAAADHYHASLFERFGAIAVNPYRYPAIDHIREGYRRSVHGSDGIYYRVNDGTVEILAIIGRQDLDRWLKDGE